MNLRYRPPYDWDALVGFLAPRQIAGVETIDGSRYARTFQIDGVEGQFEAVHVAAQNHVRVKITASDASITPKVVSRVRRLFDLDADPSGIASALSSDRLLAPLVAARPGLRVPGAFDPFELAVRAILGQQISVARATQLATRLVQAFGRERFFPTPEALSRADVAKIGMPRSRAATIVALAEAVASDRKFFDDKPAIVRDRLTSIKGIGDWTAQYISMRALGDADAFPAGDLGLQRALTKRNRRPTTAETEARSEKWRPWRAYAALHLWTAL